MSKHARDESSSVSRSDSEAASDKELATDSNADALPTQSKEATAFWEDLHVDVVELAMPGNNVGYTLRHYRIVTVTPGDTDDQELTEANELDVAVERELTEDELETLLESPGSDSPEQAEKDAEASQPTEPYDQEDVAFLAQDNKLLVFRSAEGLVAFVRSNTPNDLSTLDFYPQLRKNLAAEYVVPAEDDRYELDLVVKNLRGGHDEWDEDLLIGAGEITRDIAHACKLRSVLTALAPGSPLDDLDENLRQGGFWARRRLRKIGEEQATLAWRSVIGKLVSVIEWRD